MNAPLPRATVPVVASDAQAVIDTLLRRMREQPGFPAMSTSIGAINRLIAVEGIAATGASTLAPEILKDVALTQKILRLVNTAQYSQFASARISTISRAIVILGVDTIRSLTVSLLLMDQIRDRGRAAALGREFLRASLAALLARELSRHATVPAKSEEAYLCALFHHLGRLLVQCYSPDEADTIRMLVETTPADARERLDEDAASSRVLGAGYQAIGIAVARGWGFADAMIHSMKRQPPGRVPAAASPAEGLRALSAFSAELGATIEHLPTADRSAAIGQLCQRYQACLALDPAQVRGSLERAELGLAELARMINIDLDATALGRQLAAAVPEVATAAGDAARVEAAELPSAEPAAEDVAAFSDAQAGTPAEVEAILARGIQDISDAMVEDGKLGDLLKIVTETLFRALPVHRVILCLRDGRSHRMQARLVLGDDGPGTCARFQFALAPAEDLFNRILAHEVDVLIADSREPKVRQRLPAWYTDGFDAPNFLVMPLRLKGSPIAMIYVDADEPGRLAITPQLFALLRTLRNQALLAIKQRV
jgi:HD-like signal output (HDOD) protein